MQVEASFPAEAAVKIKSESARSTARARWLAVGVLCFLVGFSFFWRHVAGFLLLGSNYNPLVYNAQALRNSDPEAYFVKPDALLWDETYAYARYTQQVLQGDYWGSTFLVYCPYLRGANCPSRFPFYFDRLGPLVLGLGTQITGDVRGTFMLADFIFPALLTCVLVAFVYTLTRRLDVAVLGALLFIWFNWSDVVNLVVMLLGGRVTGEVLLLRTPYPQLALILFTLFLIGLVQTEQAPNWMWIIIGGLALALNFYAYVYAWTMAVVLLGILIAVEVVEHFWRGNDAQRRIVALVGIFGLGLVLAFPVWGGYLFAADVARDLAARTGEGISHSPDLRWTVILIVILLPLLFLTRKNGPFENFKSRKLWMAFWLTGIVVVNIQVLTGRSVQSGHWIQYFLEPFFGIYLVDMGLCVWQQWRRGAMLGIPQAYVTLAISLLFLLGMGQNILRLTWAAEDQKDYTRRDANFEQLIQTLDTLDPNTIIITQDAYLNRVLRGYVARRFLPPTWLDPLSQADVQRLTVAATLNPANAATNNGTLSLDTDHVVVVINRHQPADSEFSGTKRIILNDDFELGYFRE